MIIGFTDYTIITEYTKIGYFKHTEREKININNLLLNSCFYDGMSSVIMNDGINLAYKINNNLLKYKERNFMNFYKDINNTLKYLNERNEINNV